MKLIKGYQYAVTAVEDVTITDANGLNLTCPAGQQTYFVATTDEVEVVGDGVITQTRGGIIAGGGGGGGGEKIAPGEVVVGGTQGSAFITQLNECTECPMFLSELPEGVTFEHLERGQLAGISKTFASITSAFSQSGGHFGGGIFAQSTISALPSTINFVNMTDGKYMFNRCINLVSFDAVFPALTEGQEMFYNCEGLTSFTGEFPALTRAQSMFGYCTRLTSFDVDLPSLVFSYQMFQGCSGLTSWNVDLPALTDGRQMFNACTSLTSFTGELSSLTNGYQMFQSCSKMTSWNADLPALSNGEWMFHYCDKLTSFDGALSSLSGGNFMFDSCKLDLTSVNRIVSAVPSYTSGSHTIHIGVDRNNVSQEQQDAANAIMVGKGWTVTWRRN